MNITITITDGPLAPPAAFTVPGAGAVVQFEGIVRDREDDQPLAALDYEAYQPMAGLELRRLAEEMCTKHDLLGLRVEHSRGRVPVHACSFRLHIASAHRKAALLAMDEFIDRMKRDVPIWKRPVWSDKSEATPASTREVRQ